MAQASFPFDAGAGAAVLEGSWQKMSRSWLSTGVVTGRLNQLLVSADGSALSVSVATGQAQVEGFFYENDAPLALTIATANATNPRIDTVVVRLDRTANTATLVVVTGTAAASPVAPTLSATDSLFEMPLANVLVPAAAGVIVAGNVTDRRTLTKNLTEVAATAAYQAINTAALKANNLSDLANLATARTNLGVVGSAAISDVAVSTSETTVATTYTDLATAGPDVAFTPVTTRVLVIWALRMANTGVNGTYACPILFENAGTVIKSTPSDTFAAVVTPAATTQPNAVGFGLVTGLTAGVPMTARLQYRVDGGTGTFLSRHMTVIPL